MRMRQNKLTLTLLAATAMLAMSACKEDYFDEDAYGELVDYQFMVDNVDRDHDWTLTKNDTIVIQTPEYDIYSVQVLTANPYTSAKAEIAAEGITYVWDDSKAELAYTVPVTQQTLYAAALDNGGNYLGVVPFSYGTKELVVRKASLQQGGTLTVPAYQTFTYLYECTFPMPDDFDYNDMVLRITKQLPDLANSNTVDLTVTLAAAGTQDSYAAAIQLAGIRYDDISKVEIVKGERMDKDYPLMRMYIDQESTLLRGNNGEAVINLFESEQWVFSRERDELGNVLTRIYNTSHNERENLTAIADPISTTYRITFKERDKARSLTFDRIDPFLLHAYNGGNYEVHTYAHKFDKTWSNIRTDLTAYDNHISWALIIPKGDFRYPIEGLSLCNFNATLGETFGPYDGFANWMKDHTGNQAWYQTETRPQLLY